MKAQETLGGVQEGESIGAVKKGGGNKRPLPGRTKERRQRAPKGEPWHLPPKR